MQSGETPTIETIAQKITEYLKVNPRASDTVEGVTNWWLGQGERHASEELVQKALDHLVTQRHVFCRRSPDGHWLYGRGED